MNSVPKHQLIHLFHVASMYHEQLLSIEEIARLTDQSSNDVKQLLNLAQQHPFLRIELTNPLEESFKLATLIKQHYHLDYVEVYPSLSTDYQQILSDVGQQAALYLNQLVQDGDKIGIGFGKTMYSVAEHLSPKPLQGVSIIQLKGGETHKNIQHYSYDVLSLFAKAFEADLTLLPLPLFFQHPETKQTVLKDPAIHELMQAGIESNIAIFTVGSVFNDSMLTHSDYFSQAEITQLKTQAVGEILSRFIDKKGQIACQDINQRTVSLDLLTLKEKQHSILVATGSHKVDTIHSTLKGKYANTFFTDIKTATQLTQTYLT